MGYLDSIIGKTYQECKDGGNAEALLMDSLTHYFVKNIMPSVITNILTTAGLVDEIDFVAIDHNGSTHLFLDPAKHSAIELSLYNNDGTILTANWESYESVKARLEG